MLSQLFLFFLKHLNFLSSILKGSKQLVLFSTFFLAVKLPWEFIQLEMGAANAAPFLGLKNYVFFLRKLIFKESCIIFRPIMLYMVEKHSM